MRRIAVTAIVSLFGAAAYAGPAAAVSHAVLAAQLAAPIATVATAATVTTTMKAPNVQITKTCPKLRYIGRDAEFTLAVSNSGDGAATNVVVTDALPGNAEFISADGGGTREGGNVIWRLGTLDAGANKTLTVKLRCNQMGMVKNSATVTYCSEATAACEFEVKGIPAILLECVDDPDPIEVGGQSTYTITVTNQGSQADTNIVIDCELAESQEFVKAAGATQGTSSGKNVKFAPLPTLAPKAKATYMVTFKGLKSADARFKISMKSDQTETPVMETEATRIYE
jgi:uncharacterized repeat protein (TIGR01451 family)